MKKNIKHQMIYAALASIMFMLSLQSCKKDASKAAGSSGSSPVSSPLTQNSTFVTPNSTKVVEGYLALSPYYGYSYNDINYSNVTHIDFSFMTAASSTDATLVYQDQANVAAETSYYSDLTDKSFLGYGDKLLAKAHAANVKVLISIAGGTSGGVANLEAVFASPTLTGQFVNNIVTLCAQKGYDGINLDYEYPTTNAEGANILTFMQDLRLAFAASSVLKTKQMYITMAMPTGDWAAKYYDLTSLAKCVDWFSPETYDYGSNTQANMNSPLYENSAIGNSSSSDDAVTYYLSTRGVNPLQLTLAVPFYGWQYTGYTALGAPATGGARATKDMYHDFIEGGTFTEMWDATSQHTYFVNSSTGMMITYDDTQDLTTKSAYIKAKSLKGAMIWELSRGFVSGAADPNPWLTAIGTGVLH